MITIEGLQRVAKETLETAKTDLVANNRIDPALHILKEDGLMVIAFDPNWLNHGHMKNVLFGFVRQTAKEIQADAVLLLTDGWGLEQTDEQHKRLKEDPEYRAQYDYIANHQGIPGLASAGYGVLWESIMVTVQSPLYQILLTQHYQCQGDKFSRWGTFNEVSSETGALQGRLAFFDAPQGVV